jgi:hypothetical protein
MRQAAGTSTEAAAAPDPGARFLAPFDGESVMRGERNVMGVTLTSFTGGGSALGLAISHAAVDATGFYKAASAWSQLHEALLLPPDASAVAERVRCEQAVSSLVSSRDCVNMLLDEHAARRTPSAPPPDAATFDLTSWSGSLWWRAARLLGRTSLMARPKRAVLRFSRADLEAVCRRCSPADSSWRPSTNEALSTSVLRACSQHLLALPSDTAVRLHAACDMRPRARLPADFLGNAFHVLRGVAERQPPHCASVREMCAGLRTLTQRARGHASGALTHDWMEHLTQLRQGHLPMPLTASTSEPSSAPGEEAAASAPAATPLSLYSNWQARLPMLDVSFGAGPALRVVPGVGDTLHAVPAREGGVEVLLNLPGVPSRAPDWIERAHSAAFHAEIVDSPATGVYRA